MKGVKKKKMFFEDSEISHATTLPNPKPVETPAELPGSSFGDILMVVEFLRTFSELFSWKKKFKINLGSFMKALTSGSRGFKYFGKIFVFLVEIIIKEKCPVEFGVKLDEIEINIYTVSELIRLILRSKKDSNEQQDEENELNCTFYDKKEENIASVLENLDFFQLKSQNLLEILSVLIHNVMQTKTFDNFLKLKENALTSTMYCSSKESKENISASSNSLSIKHFCETPAGNCESDENNSPLDEIIYKIKYIKLRRESQKEERAKLNLEQELAKKKDLETPDKKFNQLQMYFRHEPLGEDRNYNRYWYFPTVSPFLYVEKGWKCSEELSTTPGTVESNSWFYLDTVNMISKLISSLLPEGIRESRLKEVLTERQSEFESGFKKFVEHTRKELNDVNAKTVLKEFLREDILNVQCKIQDGGLGGVLEFKEWQSRLKNATKLKEFGDLILETQHTVKPALLSGVTPVRKSLVLVQVVEQEDVEKTPEQKQKRRGRESLRDKKPKEDWKLAVDQCNTWSRLIVLFQIFKNCVKWNKSVENAVSCTSWNPGFKDEVAHRTHV